MENVQKPNNYLGLAIAGLILFWPTAIAALVNAIRTNTLWDGGKQEEAVVASQAAHKWGKMSVIIGAIFWAIYITIIFIAVIAELA